MSLVNEKSIYYEVMFFFSFIHVKFSHSSRLLSLLFLQSQSNKQPNEIHFYLE